MTFDIQRRGGAQAEALANRFGVRRDNITGLEDVVAPVAVVERVDLLCCATASVPGVAAVFSMVELFNPVGSGVWTIIHEIWMNREGPGTISLNVTAGTLETANTTNIAVLNRHVGNQEAPSTQLHTGDQASVGTSIFHLNSIGLDLGVMPSINFRRQGYEFDGIVLKEGRGLVTKPADVDIDNLTSFLFSERLIP